VIPKPLRGTGAAGVGCKAVGWRGAARRSGSSLVGPFGGALGFLCVEADLEEGVDGGVCVGPVLRRR